MDDAVVQGLDTALLELRERLTQLETTVKLLTEVDKQVRSHLDRREKLIDEALNRIQQEVNALKNNT